ncbi:MAG: hypothetical protein ACTHOJ_17880 [Sphingomonas oligoaromativorans]
MAVEIGYSRQVAPAGSPGPVQASPDAFGAGIGDAVGQVADTVRKLRADQDISNFSAAFAKARADNDQTLHDLQNGAPAGGDGYHDAVVQHLDGQGQQLLGTIRDPNVRRQAQSQWDDYVSQQSGRAFEWQAGAAAAKTVVDAKQTMDVGGNRVMTSADPSAYADESGHWEAYVQSLTGIDEATRDKLSREGHQQLAVAQNDKLTNTNPFAALTAIDAGNYNDVVSPEQLQAMRRSADVAYRRQLSQQKAADAQALQQQKVANDTAWAQMKQGRYEPDQYYALADKMDAAQQAATAVEVRAAGTEIAASESWRGATPGERQAEIERLAAKPTLTPQEGQTLRGLKGQQAWLADKSAIERMAYATNAKITPIDLSDPSSFQQRAQQLDGSWQRYGGRKDFIIPGIDPVDQFKTLIASPQRSDRVAAAMAMQAAGPYAGAILDQVAPQDHAFRSATLLSVLPNGQELMEKALKAPDAIRANPAIFKPTKGSDGKEGPNFDTIFGRAFGSALQGLPADQRTAVYDNARALYAATAGDNGWTELHPGEVLRQGYFTLGGRETGLGWAGGFGNWNGQPVVLPVGMNQAEFDRRVSRSSAAEWGSGVDQKTGQPHAALNGAPWVPSQNRTMSTSELRSLTPTMVRDGVYMLRNGNNTFVTTKDHRPYLFDVRRLSGTAPAAVAPSPKDITVLPGIGVVGGR